MGVVDLTNLEYVAGKLKLDALKVSFPSGRQCRVDLRGRADFDIGVRNVAG